MWHQAIQPARAPDHQRLSPENILNLCFALFGVLLPADPTPDYYQGWAFLQVIDVMIFEEYAKINCLDFQKVLFCIKETISQKGILQPGAVWGNQNFNLEVQSQAAPQPAEERESQGLIEVHFTCKQRMDSRLYPQPYFTLKRQGTIEMRGRSFEIFPALVEE